MKTRAFNRIFVDAENKTILKSSRNKSKLRDEVNYYLKIPREVAQLFPGILSYRGDFSAYRLELVPYKNLSDLILNNKISYLEGTIIIDNLVNILDKIHSFSQNDVTYSSMSKFCIEKTLDRMNELNSIHFFEYLSKVEILEVNDKKIKNFSRLKDIFINKFENSTINDKVCTVIHGDYCFSNILYSPDSKDIRLIDPRGSFVKPGIYGHPYYDYAKLLHCLHGGYDFIVNNHFDLIEKNDYKFHFKIKSSDLLKKLCSYFICLLEKKSIDLNYLFLIEGSLFISMANLHYESLERQKALFINGLMILNDVFSDKKI